MIPIFAKIHITHNSAQQFLLSLGQKWINGTAVATGNATSHFPWFHLFHTQSRRASLFPSKMELKLNW